MRAPWVVVAAALLVGCGSTDAPAPRPPAVLTAAPDQASSSGPSTIPRSDVGRTVTNGDIAITVKVANTVDAIELNRTGSRTGSGSERFTTTPAGDGARYVLVTTRVANNGRSGFTMTCNVPIRTAVVDDQQHTFGPIDDLDELQGNPDCDNKLQPGAVHDVTWSYLVPSTARITTWTFQDVTDPHTHHDPTTVRLVTS